MTATRLYRIVLVFLTLRFVEFLFGWLVLSLALFFLERSNIFASPEFIDWERVKVLFAFPIAGALIMYFVNFLFFVMLLPVVVLGMAKKMSTRNLGIANSLIFGCHTFLLLFLSSGVGLVPLSIVAVAVVVFNFFAPQLFLKTSWLDDSQSFGTSELR